MSVPSNGYEGLGGYATAGAPPAHLFYPVGGAPGENRGQILPPSTPARLDQSVPQPFDYSTQPNPNAAGLGLQEDVFKTQDVMASYPTESDIELITSVYPNMPRDLIESMTPAVRANAVKAAKHQTMLNQLHDNPTPTAAQAQVNATNQSASTAFLKVYKELGDQYTQAQVKLNVLSAGAFDPVEVAAAQAEVDNLQDKVTVLLSHMPEGTQLPSESPWVTIGMPVLSVAGTILNGPQEWIKGRLGDNAYDITQGKPVRHKVDGLVAGSFVTGVIGIAGDEAFSDWANDPANADVIKRAYEGGFQKNGTSQRFTGGRAVWEMFIDSQSTLTKALYDTGLDPWSYTGIAKSGTGFLKALSEGADLVKLGKVAYGVDKAVHIADLLAGGWVDPFFDRLRLAIKAIPGGIFANTPRQMVADDTAEFVTNLMQFNYLKQKDLIAAGWTYGPNGNLIPPPGTIVPPYGGVPTPGGAPQPNPAAAAAPVVPQPAGVVTPAPAVAAAPSAPVPAAASTLPVTGPNGAAIPQPAAAAPAPTNGVPPVNAPTNGVQAVGNAVTPDHYPTFDELTNQRMYTPEQRAAAAGRILPAREALLLPENADALKTLRYIYSKAQEQYAKDQYFTIPQLVDMYMNRTSEDAPNWFPAVAETWGKGSGAKISTTIGDDLGEFLSPPTSAVPDVGSALTPAVTEPPPLTGDVVDAGEMPPSYAVRDTKRKAVIDPNEAALTPQEVWNTDAYKQLVMFMNDDGTEHIDTLIADYGYRFDSTGGLYDPETGLVEYEARDNTERFAEVERARARDRADWLEEHPEHNPDHIEVMGQYVEQARQIGNGRSIEDVLADPHDTIIEAYLAPDVVDPDWPPLKPDTAMYRQPAERLGTQSSPPLLDDQAVVGDVPEPEMEPVTLRTDVNVTRDANGKPIPIPKTTVLRAAPPREVELVQDTRELQSLFTPADRRANGRMKAKAVTREQRAAEAKASKLEEARARHARMAEQHPITLDPKARGEFAHYMIDGQKHPYARVKRTVDQYGNATVMPQIFDAEHGQWEDLLEEPFAFQATTPPPTKQARPPRYDGTPEPGASDLHAAERLHPDDLGYTDDDLAAMDAEHRLSMGEQTPATAWPAHLKRANFKEIEEVASADFVQQAIRENMFRMPNKGKIVPPVAETQLFGSTVPREFTAADLSIPGGGWRQDAVPGGELRGDPYLFKTIAGSNSETALFGGKPMRLASKDRNEDVVIQVMNHNEEWVTLTSTHMTRADLDRSDSIQKLADVLNEELRLAGGSPAAAVRNAESLGIMAAPNNMLAYALNGLYQSSPGFAKWVDRLAAPVNLGHQVNANLMAVRLPTHTRVHGRVQPIIRSVPISDETTRVINQRMLQPSQNGVYESYFDVFSRQLETKYGLGVNAVTASPQQIMSNYAGFMGRMVMDRDIPDANLLGKIFDRMASHYSEFTLLMPWSLPRQLIGNTLIGNITQIAAASQLHTMRYGISMQHLVNLERYALKGIADPMDSEIGAKMVRRGFGGWDPRIVSHTSLDAQTGRLEGSSAARATRDDLTDLNKKVGATKTGATLQKWAGRATHGWVGKSVSKPVDGMVWYVETARNLINGMEYAQRTSLAFFHSDTYVRSHMANFVDQAVDRAATMAPHLRPSEVRAAMRNMNHEFDAIDIRDRFERLWLMNPPTGSGKTAKDARIFADRVARDYAGLINDAGKYGYEQMGKVLFAVEMTKADTILRRIIPFHLYTSRAVPFYAKQALRHPGFALAYYRSMEGLDKRAEEEGWPDWMKGYAKLFDGPFGMDLYFKPLAALGILDFVIESNGGYNDDKKTWLAEQYEKVSGTTGMGVYPWLMAPFALSGLMGDTNLGLDPLGSGAMRKFIGTGIQLLASTGLLGDDYDRYLGKPYEQRLRDMRAWISDILPAVDTVESTDASAGGKETIGNIWLDQELKRRGLSYEEWHAMQVANNLDSGKRTPEETAQAAIFNEIVQSWTMVEETDDKSYHQAVDAYAQGMAVTAGVGVVVAGPRTVQQDDQMDKANARSVTFAAGTRDGITFTGDETADLAAYKAEYRKEFGRDPSEEQLEGYIQAHQTDAQLLETTPEARPLVVAHAQWNILGTAKSRELQDTKNSILFGYIDVPVRIAGRTFTPEEIRGMKQDGRDWLAGQYLLANDPTGTVTELEREQDAFKASHPAYAEYKDWGSSTRKQWDKYSLAEYRRRTSELNPGAAKYYADQRRAIMTEHPTYSAAQIESEMDAITFTMGAYMATFGIKQRYTDPDPKGNGQVAEPRVADSGGATLSSTTGPKQLTTMDVSTAIAAYEFTLKTANDYLSAQAGGRPVNYKTLIPPAQAVADQQLQAAGITMPETAAVAADYYDWRDKQEGLGKNSSVAAYVQMINAGGSEWRERRKTTDMGGWYWVDESGDDYVNELGFDNSKEGSLDPMGQRITTAELIDQLLGGQNITAGLAPSA